MKRLALFFSVIMMICLIFSGSCISPAPEAELAPILPESGLTLVSTKAESVLINNFGLSTEYFLEDPQNVFLTVTFRISPPVESKIFNINDIVLNVDESEYFYPVGLDFGPNQWFMFTTGTVKLEFVPESQQQMVITFDSQYDWPNVYGIKPKEASRELIGKAGGIGKVESQKATNSGKFYDDNETFSLSYVVKRESISSSRFLIEIPNSQPIELDIR